ncbi:MAG: PTS glucose transporter subunit IIA [Bacillota bacterium]|nr:PTS glucose transporter subunit IIA [Bacillota bacterium]
MFGFLSKANVLKAPIAGKVIDLKEVPDQVFAEKMAGDGAAILSTGDTIVSPADGKLFFIFKTNHAFGLKLDNGAEILVHIGVDTVELKGEGFTRIAEEGTYVKAGDPIIKLDREFIISKGYSLVTPVLITNADIIKKLEVKTGKEVKSGDVMLSYKL